MSALPSLRYVQLVSDLELYLDIQNHYQYHYGLAEVSALFPRCIKQFVVILTETINSHKHLLSCINTDTLLYEKYRNEYHFAVIRIGCAFDI